MNYTYRIIIEPDGKYFHAFVPTLKGCHTFGKTITEVKKHIKEAIEVYVEGLAKMGEPIPQDESMEVFTTIYLDKKKVYV